MYSRTENFTVEQSLPRARLDIFLREKFPAVSRGAIAAADRTRPHPRQRQNRQAHASSRARANRLKSTGPKPGPPRRSRRKCRSIFCSRTNRCSSLNKPAGLVVHPAAGHEEHTLVNALLHHCRGSLSGIGGVARPGIVHRLDKETSGCLVVAKNDETHLALSEQFAERARGKNLQRDRLRRTARATPAKSAPPSPGIRRTANAWPCATTAIRPRRAHKLARAGTAERAPRWSRRRSTPAARTRFACISSFSAIRSWATTPTARGKMSG